MLQGARDVQRQFLQKNISYAFHLANRDDRRPHLVLLAAEASMIVTEDMPVDPPRQFLNALKRKTDTPIICVDTACLAPMQLVKKAYTRAFEFRAATEKLYAGRLTCPWPDLNIENKTADAIKLPFEPMDLQSENLAELISRCEIDHAIGPVVDTEGGSTAGYKRWNDFKAKGLARYARQRNDALLDGVSRMSPYLHYGMVSPFRLAREVSQVKNAEAEKFLDELLIWRELAYSFCFYRDDHDQWSALPTWAQETLLRHSGDRRQDIYSWEQLARGETSDQFWNAAQKSLLMQGELHNNVRMTWGKAILNWKRSPQEALETIFDLNHRYALDGRDPASFGGILWCFGQFDRPFEPEHEITGCLRLRTTTDHADRLDPEKYLAKVTKPRFHLIPKVAILGAGISGLLAARSLQDHGVQVTVFEKSRGVGGRMATRRLEDGGTFDHGAQYFTARDPRFIRYVTSWIEQGIVGKWPDHERGADQKIVVLRDGAVQMESDSEDRYVAIPTMNSICRHLADNLTIRTESQIAKVVRINAGIELFNSAEQSFGKFDRLIVSIPSLQAAELLNDFPMLTKQISKIEMNPCWAAMASFATPLTDQWAGAFLHGSILSWAARNNTKPGRNWEAEHLIIHASPDWTLKNWEREPAEIADEMLSEFWRVSGIQPRPSEFCQAHRWKYAIPTPASVEGSFAVSGNMVCCCGDWASGSRVEGAFLSGMSAAGRILRTLLPENEGSDSTRKLLFEN